uniref:Uncharacterized protein n=1 Tax=Timema monikensis TaxID=170555 RepID=A0A7R9HHM3_9NEOP|nr:unnamed protein product [Timema monikensis]
MRNKERCREVANTKPCGTSTPVRLMDPEVYWGNPGNSEGSSFQPNIGKDERKETERMGEPCDCKSFFLETRRVGLGLVRALCVKVEIGVCSAAPLYHRVNGYSRRILFDNIDHDGQMLLSLDAESIRLDCQGDVKYVELKSHFNLSEISGTFVVCYWEQAICLFGSES